MTTRFRYKYGGLASSAYTGGGSSIKLGHFQSRIDEISGGVTTSRWSDPYAPQTYVPQYGAVTWIEHMWDELHPRSRNPRTGGRIYLTGGPMLKYRIDMNTDFSGVYAKGEFYNASGTQRYVGGFSYPSNDYWGLGWGSDPFSYASQSNSLLPDVAMYFDRAWRKAKPRLETAGLFVFFREAKEIMPMLHTTSKLMAMEWKDGFKKVQSDFGPVWAPSSNLTVGSVLGKKRMYPRNVADQFLNQQFGWAPFVNDITSTLSTWLDTTETIRRITAENGKWVQKKVKVDKTNESRVISNVVLPYNATSYAVPCFPVAIPSDYFLAPPRWRVVEVEQTSISASGKFRFYRPEFDSSLPGYESALRKVQRLIKIYGLEVNPHHLWQSIPWTWLIDWFSNVGDYVERLSDTIEDDVAAEYFFITSHKNLVRTMEIVLPMVNGTLTLVFKRTFSSKQRVNADSPYGFSLSWDDLSPKRLSILASLGITRKS